MAKRLLPSITSASLERLEDRVMLATLDFSNGAIEYTGGGAANTLTVETVESDDDTRYRFTDTDNIDLTISDEEAESCSVDGPMVVQCRASDVMSIDIDLAGDTDSATVGGLTLTGNLSVTAGSITISDAVSSDSDVTLTANNGSITATSAASPFIKGDTVTFVVNGTGEIGSPGPAAGPTKPLEIEVATLLNATTENGNIVLESLGDLPLGALNAGTAMILLTASGAITDGTGGVGDPNLTAANGVNLMTAGAIGREVDMEDGIGPIRTAIGALTATTEDGGVYINDTNSSGLMINTVLAKEDFKTPFIGGGNQIVVDLDDPESPATGTHDVSITAQGPILLNRVTAPNAVTISSLANRILDMNQESTDVLARRVNLIANGAVGQDSDPIEMSVESFSARTTNGDIFLAQGIVGTAESVVAGGADRNVLVTSTAETLRIKVITAQGTVTVRNDVGSLQDENAAAVNFTGQVVDLTGRSGVGSAADPLETTASELAATASDSAAVIHINETDGLDSVAATTNAGDVTIDFAGGPLVFTASDDMSTPMIDETDLLSASGAAVTFETTTGNVKLGLVDAGTGDVKLTAAGRIADDTDDDRDLIVPENLDIIGRAVTLTAGTGSNDPGDIGASGNKIDTQVEILELNTSRGGIFIRELDALTLTAASTDFADPATMTGSDIDVSNTTGNVTLGPISALNQVTVQSAGAILDGNGMAANVFADALQLSSSSGIGTTSDSLETSVNSLNSDGGAGGGLFVSNNKALTLTLATAMGGDVAITAAGNLTLASQVTANGQEVTLNAAGELVDVNDAGDDIAARSVRLVASSIGFGNRIETNASEITARTTAGGIFLSNGSDSLTLTTTALGRDANIDVESAGSIVLNAAIAQGDAVRLRAAASITDGNDTQDTTPVNIIAKTLDIIAPGGIGTPDNRLEVDVDQILAADGGAGGTNLINTGPLLLTQMALEAGTGTLSFDAESITIENFDDGTNIATIGRDISLVLRTQTGPIVFLGAEDTIQTQGAGTITIQAGTMPGSGGVAVLGNLKTAGGNILVTADRTITIGQLDAGTGDVTVRSRSGIIVDGNGTALNVIAGTTTLSGAAPTAREAQLDESSKIAGAAAASAEAAAKLTSADSFRNGSEIVNAAMMAAQSAVDNAITVVAAKQAIFDPLDQTSSRLEISIEVFSGIALGLSVAAAVADAVAAVAQAIPVVGDGGANAGASVVVIGQQVADAALLAQTIAKDKVDTKRGNALTALTEAKAELAAAGATLTSTTTTSQAYQESLSVAEAAAEKAVIIRDASARVRDQAILARDQVNVIGTFTEPLGLQVTGVVNVTAGPTDSFLQVVGATAVDLIQATGSVTLISTGAISDADASGGADITGLGLTTIAVGGIGTAADPLETRVATLNATNTVAGDIAIDNTAGAPAALDITGISNSGGGDVIISNQGSTSAGEGITVSGAISATGAGAAVTINSLSPLTIDSDIAAAAAIVMEASETADAGDDLTVNAGVTIESTGSSVTLRAGDNITVSSGATIQANTAITITADINDDAADTTGANVIVTGTLVAPMASIGVDAAADDDDTFTITPSATTPIAVDAEDGSDTLNFTADGLPVTILGNQITAQGHQPVTFDNFEFVNITNVDGGGSVTLLTAPGTVDVLILTGIGEEEGTFTLNGGIPISFSGVNRFDFNAGDMNDQSTVSPFATNMVRWRVAVTIDGGDGTDRITYNNVAGLMDETSVTASAPQAGHIDSPFVTSALNGQVVSFINVEDITANANPGENEKLTVNLRDTGAADAAIVRFDPDPTGDDVQLFGLFDVIVDTANYAVLTLNGNEGDDTFIVAPGPIPVFVDGNDPIASDRLVVEDQAVGNTVRLHQGTDQRSGSVHVGALPPVWYSGIEFVEILPLDPVTGGAGTDGNGRVVVFHPDTFSNNNSRLNPTEISDLMEHTAKPNISPGGATDPFGLGFDLPGDEDWYRFTATKTGTFQFEVVHDPVPTLANGQPGLPGDGLLRVDVYQADGAAIVRSASETEPAVQTIGVKEGDSYLLRVRGQTPEAINLYDISVIDKDMLGPQVFDPDGAGPEQAVQITGHPTFNLFDVKPVSQGPTPLVDSITVNIQDLPRRFPGFVYGALDTDISSAVGNYTVIGDHNGIIPISEVIVTNAPIVEGDLPTATIEIRFENPLPDDRFTLTLSDSIADPSGNQLDGESNANEPQGAPTFPSGNTVPGGDFVARFTVDSRAELGVWAAGSVYVDTNGNFQFDPESHDTVNEDITYVLGFTTDNIFAGNFATSAGGVADGFDKLAAYGRVAGAFRWLIDTDNNGVPNLVVADPSEVNGLPIAGSFDGNDTNGDEVGLKDGTNWHLDTDHDFNVDTTIAGNIIGYPIVGDFDGDGVDDLGAWTDDTFSLDLSTVLTGAAATGSYDANINGMADVQFTFGFPGVRERPFAADFDGDGIDDLGLWAPDRNGAVPEETSEWYIFISAGTPIPDRIVTNPQAIGGNIVEFTPVPFGNDLYAQFGDDFALPVVGNFDPPVDVSVAGPLATGIKTSKTLRLI